MAKESLSPIGLTGPIKNFLTFDFVTIFLQKVTNIVTLLIQFFFNFTKNFVFDLIIIGVMIFF